MNIVELTSVYKYYWLGKARVEALKNISMSVALGEFLAVAGPSGSGKTTLLNLIGIMDSSSSGNILIQGNSVSEMNDRQRTKMRADTIGFIFQSFNLIPLLNVVENVELPLLLNSKPAFSKKQNREWAIQLIENVGLLPYLKNRPSELSGGQRQRVAIARALVTKPAIVVADEPTANLDSKTGHTIIEIMRKINEEFKTTFIFSTHDPSVLNLAMRIIRLRDGSVEE